MNIKETITRLSQGNPGAATVLLEIASTDPMFLNPLGVAMELTGSKGYALWMVYKDRCKHDIEATKAVLREWFDSSCLPLEQWLEGKK